MDSLSFVNRLVVVLAALAAFCGTWALGDILTRKAEAWRARYLEEAEYELDEMLLQTPAAAIFNWSLIAACVIAVLFFLLFASFGGSFDWRVGLLFAGIGFGGTVWGSRMALRLLKARRLDRFNEQLEEALMGMSNSLKAGFSINQAIDMVIKQNKQPISLEFRLMMQQTHLGMSFDDALSNMAQRVQSEDFFLVASAISTARMTGGDLTGVLDRLAAMIRERQRIQRRIRTLTAQGRLQGIVLGGLPMLLLVILFFMDPDMVKTFFTQPLGIVLFLIVVALEIGGFLTIKKIVTIDI